MIIGITGGTGCGKTTLLKEIQTRGGMIFDCDVIYHQLLTNDKAMLDAIEARFPGTMEDGVLNRKKLGNLVFGDEKALLDLNQITHGAVKREVQQQLAQYSPALGAIDAIGLFESGLAQLCDTTVAVTAPEEIRVKRLMVRDGIAESYARSRIRAQRSEDFFRESCDHVLENNGTLESFQEKCAKFLAEILD